MGGALAALAMLAASGAQTDEGYRPQAALPTSFNRKVLRTCAPNTLSAAEICLSAALSVDDAGILGQRIPSRRFRGYIDCEIELAWRLGDPHSLMGKLMDHLRGVHNPGMAASMIISDYQVRATDHTGFDFDGLRKAIKVQPAMADGSQTTCTETTTPPSQEMSDAH